MKDSELRTKSKALALKIILLCDNIDTKKGRGKMLINKVAQTEADAVIVAMMKFCDPEEWDYPVFYREFEEKGIKNLMIEVDQEVTSFEQVKTRLQSFVEML